VSFVFNGDFVDRGRHQLALVGLLFALKVSLPDKIFLIRGNHEERSMNTKYGFQAELHHLLGRDLGEKLLYLMHKVFDVLPLGCVVDKKILTVHGGLGDARWGLRELMAVQRPLKHEDLFSEDNEWINSIMWSDPIEDDNDNTGNAVFGVHASPRGKVAKQFGWDVTKVFCARNGLSLIVRSHQSKRGSPGFDVMHENLLMRVFSARDYEGHANDGAVLFVRKMADTKTDVVAQDSGDQPKSEKNDKDILWVRPQVLRSCAKARKDAIRMRQKSDKQGDGSDASASPVSSGSRKHKSSRRRPEPPPELFPPATSSPAAAGKKQQDSSTMKRPSDSSSGRSGRAGK